MNRQHSLLDEAARDVLRDCPQAEPVAMYYETAEEFAEARALWNVARKLRPALVMTTGAQS